MQYMRAYKYVFESPKWLQNILLGTVCMLIPIVGPIVLMGYLCEVMESMVRDETRVYSDFDFSRFGDYLKRGVWVFLVSLVVGLVSMPLSILCYVLIILSVLLFKVHVILGILAVILAIALFICMIVCLWIVTEPIVIRAALLQDFAPAFSWSYIRDFCRRMAGQVLLAHLFLMVSSIVLMIGGMMLFCVGMYLAIPLAMYAQFHLHFQLHQEYVRRGGMAIPLPALPDATAGPM